VLFWYGAIEEPFDMVRTLRAMSVVRRRLRVDSDRDDVAHVAPEGRLDAHRQPDNGSAETSAPLAPAMPDAANGGEATGELAVLTAREREVVCLIAEGKSNKNIAHLLDISTKTVESHRSAAMRKLNVHSTAQLVRCAIRCRLVSP